MFALRARFRVWALICTSTMLVGAAGLYADRGPADRGPDMELEHLIIEEWDYQMSQNPVWASLLGDRRFNDRWDDMGAEARAADHEHNKALLQRLDEIGRDKLSPAKQLDWDLLRYDVAQWVEEDELAWHLMPVSHLGWLPEGFRQRPPLHTAHQLGGQLRFETLKDYEDWLQRLRTFHVYVQQNVALMRQGLERGRVRPKVIVERLIQLVQAQAETAVEDSGFFLPFLSWPEAIADTDRERLRAAAHAVIAESVLPALEGYHGFLVQAYLPASSDSVALGDVSDGKALYELFVRKYTTTNMSADEVHELGLGEVERIRGEMEQVRRQVAFEGTLGEFFEHLRTDPKFFYQQPDALLTGYRALSKRVDPLLVGYFGVLPRMPYGVEPIDAAIAPQATTGYYFPASQDGSRAGTYQVNLYRPESRPKWEMVPLTLHEAMPGHHLQVSIAAELEGLSAFRRFNYHSAYGEGWGLYAEWLGYEMGLYEDPYDRFGQLAFEMWRAVRLVVDTGMHAKGWSRERSIDYFLANSPRPKLDVVNEIDRYIALPAQALSYKVGQLEIQRLRRRAADALKDDFDVRAFHDLVLGAGSMPLSLLERRVEQWLESSSQSVVP